MDISPAIDPVRAIEAAGAAQVDDSLRRILVVDDESTIRLALSRFLRTRGYEVEMADSGAGALAILAEQRFSLMLCDLRMPGVSGLEVVPQALARDPHLGIIMLTAVNDAQSATDALSNGAFDYLTKPVELPDLQAAVERASMRRMRSLERHAIDRLIREEVALRTVQLEREKEALRALMKSLTETGERSQALRAYQRFATRLRDELEAEPDAETLALAGSIKG